MHEVRTVVGMLLLTARVYAGDTTSIIGVLEQDDVNTLRMICPCEFNLGKHVNGKTVLVVDHNADGKPAFAKLDGSVVRLSNTTPMFTPMGFDCEPGKRVRGVWKAERFRVEIDVATDGPGEESCWFHGSLVVARGKRHETKSIVGACGC